MATDRPNHLLHIFSSFAVGGSQVRTCDIINHFGQKYRHTIFAMDSNYKAREKLNADLEIDFLQLKFNKKNTFNNLFLFRSLLKKIHPDLLLTYNWGSIDWVIANYLFPICPNIHIEDGFNSDEANSQKIRRIWTRRFFLPRIFKVVVPSLTLKEIAIRVWGLKTSIVAYIPNGVDIDKYRKVKEFKSNIIIGTVGALRKVKNYLRLIRIFSKLSQETNAQLWIVGEGAEYKNLKEFIKEKRLEEKVLLLGHKEDISEVMNKFDIFCISSDSEQMPISVLEAMAAGCAIISTDVGDVKEIVAEENRQYIVDKDDEDKFASFIETLIKDERLRDQLGIANQSKCQMHYDKDQMFKSYERLYDMAIIPKSNRFL